MDLKAIETAQDTLVSELDALVTAFRTSYPIVNLSNIHMSHSMGMDENPKESFKCTVSAKVEDATITRTL
jgi:hypothetical protein